MPEDRFLLASFAAGWIMVVGLGLILAVALQLLGEIHLKNPLGHHALITDEGPALHEIVPELKGHDIDGRLISALRYRGRRLVVVFLSATCGPCEPLLSVIPSTCRELLNPPEFLLVLEALRVEVMRYLDRHRLNLPVIVDPGHTIRVDLGIERIPYGLLVDQDGVVRMKGVINNRRQLEGLIAGRGRSIENASWQPPPAGPAADRRMAAATNPAKERL